MSTLKIDTLEGLTSGKSETVDALIEDRLISQTANDVAGTAALLDTGTAAGELPTNADLGSASLVDTGTAAGDVPLNSDLGSASLVDAIGSGDLYGRDSILGTVSESGGVPTGAIIERGSNANGEYVKFADGTMICSRMVSSTIDINLTVDVPSGTFRNNSIEYDYASIFTADPVVTASNSFNQTGTKTIGLGVTPIVIQPDSINISWSSTESLTALPVLGQIVAIGRWY